MNKLLEPDGDIHQCLIEFTKLINLMFMFMSSKYFISALTGPRNAVTKERLKGMKGKGVVRQLTHDDVIESNDSTSSK